ncbi:hypothetical protein [Fibrobacter sp.]|uniref:hypothetical protein n=1 Tax=Fibrobacter sp. TaxID=35828 RepID=UPI00386E296D
MTVTTTALLTLVSRNLPALSFLSARHVVSPLRVKLKNVPPNRENFWGFVKAKRPKTHKNIQKMHAKTPDLRRGPGGYPHFGCVEFYFYIPNPTLVALEATAVCMGKNIFVYSK